MDIAMDLAPGVHVTDNLRLKRRLGEGGMASVWAAEHLTLRVEVAVKFIASELVGQAPDVVARFNREATAVAKIKSPHVVQVLDHGMMRDGTPFIAMELLEGEDLGARLDREGKLTMEETVSVVAQVAKALARAHAVGIVHRDIKPDNIFLVRGDDDDELFVKVLDFGIAKHTQKTTQSVVTVTGTLVGTPAYMSPEQVLSGKHVDERSDLWSLGVVAYHALTGEVPFEGPTLGALCVAISRGTFIAPSYLEPTLPAAIDAWMNRALAQRPEHRFESPKELADALRDAAASGPVAVDEVGPFSRPSADFGLAPDAEPAPSSRASSRGGRVSAHVESVVVLPTQRVASPVMLVGGAALVAGVVGAAAFVRSGATPEDTHAAAGTSIVAVEPAAASRGGRPNPVHVVEASPQVSVTPPPSALASGASAAVESSNPPVMSSTERGHPASSTAKATPAPAKTKKNASEPHVLPTDGAARPVDRGF